MTAVGHAPANVAPARAGQVTPAPWETGAGEGAPRPGRLLRPDATAREDGEGASVTVHGGEVPPVVRETALPEGDDGGQVTDLGVGRVAATARRVASPGREDTP